ncbi:MAG: hypothetical protein WD426_17755 [Anditalea sp.]
MKKFICLISVAGLISLGSCDNSNRGIEGNEDAENDLMDQRDTSGIKEEFNSRGVPAEGLNDHNAIRDDSIEVDSDNSEIMAGLPTEITEKIMADENLGKKRVTNSRKYSEGGTTFYELTFDNDESTKITFDERGNKSLNQ